jgi:predicted solute-binding protein
LPKLRISVVQYLNTSPLVWGFTHGLLEGKYDLSFTVPSQCAEQLRAGDVDIAIIPAIEYQRIDDLVILPDLAIASKRRVRSLLLISKVPLTPAPLATARSLSPIAATPHRDHQSRELHAGEPYPAAGPRSIALDRSSRSTQALTKILCARHWQIAPQFQEMAPDLAAMLAAHDAALLIGDPALRVSLAIERTSLSQTLTKEGRVSLAIESTRSSLNRSTPPLGSAGVPAGVFSSASAPSPSNRTAENRSGLDRGAPPQSAAPEICAATTLGIANTETLYVYDIVSEWRALTGLSAVLAIWAARTAVATPEVVADFHASRAFGLLHLPELCREAAAQLQLPAPALHSYLTDNIDFTLDPGNVSALTRFFVEAHALDLTPASKPVLLAPGPNSVELEPALANPRGSLKTSALDILYEERKRDRDL